jgi:hypothetical protein
MKSLKIDARFAGLAAVAAVLITSGCAPTKSNETRQSAAPVAHTPTAIAPTPTPAAAASAMPMTAGAMPMTAGAMPSTPGAMASTMMLTGSLEVPPNPSAASGKSTITIAADKTVTGMIVVSGMTPTMAHIHEASKGVNGPVIVPFVKSGENNFAPAPGAKLTDAQYASYLAGKLYLNVHSSTYPGGEIRLQMMPAK